jgi:hypothetical protein
MTLQHEVQDTYDEIFLYAVCGISFSLSYYIKKLLFKCIFYYLCLLW